jgi:hypothetical protein
MLASLWHEPGEDELAGLSRSEATTENKGPATLQDFGDWTI